MTSDSITTALVIVKGWGKDKPLPLETNLITVGRGTEADISLPGDSSLSRIHFTLRQVNGRYVLTNNSDNGTLVNEKVTDSRKLVNGDRIQIGEHYVLEFSDGTKAASGARKSFLARPGLMIGGGLYIAAIVAAAVVLSNTEAGMDVVSSDDVNKALNGYQERLKKSKLPADEQFARQQLVHGYLRAGFIAEREGNYTEARRIYLKIMDYTQDGLSPVYKFALVRLRAMPIPEK